MSNRFKVWKVTPKTHALIRGLEEVAMLMGEAESNEDIDAAFEKINLVRAALYSRIEAMEAKCFRPEERTEHLRF